jgi:hypothetical protein
MIFSLNDSINTKGGKDKEAQLSSQSQAPSRKARRCWAPELHRRFLQALQQLGGSHGLLLVLAARRVPPHHRKLVSLCTVTLINNNN